MLSTLSLLELMGVRQSLDLIFAKKTMKIILMSVIECSVV